MPFGPSPVPADKRERRPRCDWRSIAPDGACWHCDWSEPGEDEEADQ